MSLEDEVTKIDLMLFTLKDKCRQIGMEEETIDKYLMGTKIYQCAECRTYNMYEQLYSKRSGFIIYHCNGCDKSKYINLWQKNG